MSGGIAKTNYQPVTGYGTNRIAKYFSDAAVQNKGSYTQKGSPDLQKLLYGLKPSRETMKERYERIASLERKLEPVPSNKKCPLCGSLAGMQIAGINAN